MNEYEKYLIEKNVGYWIKAVGQDKGYGTHFDTENNKLVLKQDEDINLTKYLFAISINPDESAIKNVSFYDGKKWTDVKLVTKQKDIESRGFFYNKGEVLYIIDLDFNNRIKTIRFEYQNNIVDPINISVEYVEADKDAYYQKVEARRKKELLEKMSVSHSTGHSLVNIYWQNANEDVKKTLLELFLDNKQLILKNEMDANTFFKSIPNLAYGTYYFRLSQFDSNDNLIIATDLIMFCPDAPNYSGRRVVYKF